MGKPTFDFVASLYPLLEHTVFGSTLSRARRFFISQVTEGSNILLIGEGNGRFLFEMAKQTSSGSVTVVDSSTRMLAAAARRLATVDHCSRIEFIHADILEWRSPAAHYDRIVTHFFLDLFTPCCLRQVVEKISRLATEDTLWINVDFTSKKPMPSARASDVGAIPLLSAIRGNPSLSALRPGSLFTGGWLGNFGTEITGFRLDLCASNVQKA